MIDIASLKSLVEKVKSGQQISDLELSNCTWSVPKKVERYALDLWRDVQRYHNDEDIRQRDPRYEKNQRDGIVWRYERLLQEL